MSEWEKEIDKWAPEANRLAYPEAALESESNHRILLPQLFPTAFGRAFAPHHDDLWCWGLGGKAGTEDKPVEFNGIRHGVYERPFVALWPRGGGKSTQGEALIATLGGRKARRHVLVISGTQDQANERVAGVEAKMRSESFARVFPHMAEPRRSDITGAVKKWSMSQIITNSGFMFHALGLDSQVRGAKTPEDFRPDFIWLDDVDHLNDSLQEVGRKEVTIFQSIIMTRASHCAILFSQNLIHANSMASKLANGTAHYLSRAYISGPIKAVENFTYRRETQPDNRGIMRERIVVTGGDYTWPEGQGPVEVQDAIDETGLDAFLRESNHEVHRPPEGASFPMYDELYTVITWPMFHKVFGKHAEDAEGGIRIPVAGFKANLQDFGTTLGHPTANIWVWRPQAGMPLTDTVFVYRELILPEWPNPVTTIISPLVIGKAVADAERPWGEHLPRAMHHRLISHERPGERNFYQHDLPNWKPPDWPAGLPSLIYQQWDPHKNTGIGILQSYLTPIETHLPRCLKVDLHLPICECGGRANPFRDGVMGRTRLVFIVAEDQGQIVNGRVAPGYNADGLARLRAEIVDHTDRKLKNPSEKIFDDACCVAGTRISTSKGLRPIESVRIGDRVLTRKGYREVIAAELTHSARPCYKLSTTNGLELVATANHPIWTSRGFVRMDSLRPGDTLECQEFLRASLLSSTESGSIAIQGLGSGPTECITSPLSMRGSGGFRRSIRKFGRWLTGQFQMATSSTIKTRIPKIILLRILSVLRNPSILKDTWPPCVSGLVHLSSETTWSASVHWPSPLGDYLTQAQRDMHDTLSMVERHGRTGSHVSLSAHTVVPRLSRKSTIKDFVTEPASSGLKIITKALLEIRGRVRTAVLHFFQRFITQSTAHPTVKSVMPIPSVWPVYNLAVEGEAEYYANGILCHNCDALRKGAEDERIFLPVSRPSEKDVVRSRIPEAYRSEAPPAAIEQLNPVALQNRELIAHYMLHETTATVRREKEEAKKTRSSKVRSYHDRLRRIRGV